MIKVYNDLISRLECMAQSELRQVVDQCLAQMFSNASHGDLKKWMNAIHALPEISGTDINLNQSTVSIASSESISKDDKNQMHQNLMQLHPWRKGPFNLLGTQINTEWRSDLKWDRIKHSMSDLTHRNVLDVGCGSGYHCFRMAGGGAKFVLGIEPFPLFVMQYLAIKKYCSNLPVWVVPLRIEDMPQEMRFFDTVFSMGILYHLMSPFEHLQNLKALAINGGEVVLETIVVEGALGHVLVPQGRYGKMRNVWFLPSTLTLENWLKKTGFKNISLIDITTTTTDEQRQTDWMTFESFAQYLDPNDATKTIEGHPAPQRATFIMNV